MSLIAKLHWNFAKYVANGDIYANGEIYANAFADGKTSLEICQIVR